MSTITRFTLSMGCSEGKCGHSASDSGIHQCPHKSTNRSGIPITRPVITLGWVAMGGNYIPIVILHRPSMEEELRAILRLIGKTTNPGPLLSGLRWISPGVCNPRDLEIEILKYRRPETRANLLWTASHLAESAESIPVWERVTCPFTRGRSANSFH